MKAGGRIFRDVYVRKRVVRARFRDVCRFFLWLFLLGLPALLPASQPASGTVTVFFHPDYHLDDIDPWLNNVASDGLHPAVFKVQVLDHRDIAIPDVEVDWSVNSDGVEVSAGNTDPQGYSWAWLRSETEGTFDVTASWHNELGMSSEKKSSVTFKESTPLYFTNKTVSMTFGQANTDVQQYSGGNGDLGGEITYRSSCPEVANFDQPKSGNLTMNKVGVTMITATEAGSDHFSGQSASYLLVVTPADGKDISFPKPDMRVSENDAPFEARVTGSNDKGTISYKSDREEVAKVDSLSGRVELVSPGIAKIIARQELDNYKTKTAELTLTVDPVPLTMSFRSPVTIGTIDVEVKGKKNQNVKLYKSDNLVGDDETDDNGDAKFKVEIKKPNQTVAIKCIQGESEITKLLEVESYITSVAPAFIKEVRQNKIWLKPTLKVDAKFKADPDGKKVCYTGWDAGANGCSAIVYFKDGKYQDLPVTQHYVERFSEMEIDTRTVSKVTISPSSITTNGKLVEELSITHEKLEQDCEFFRSAHPKTVQVTALGAGSGKPPLIIMHLDEFGEFKKDISSFKLHLSDLLYWGIQFATDVEAYISLNYVPMEGYSREMECNLDFPFIHWNP